MWVQTLTKDRDDASAGSYTGMTTSVGLGCLCSIFLVIGRYWVGLGVGATVLL